MRNAAGRSHRLLCGLALLVVLGSLLHLGCALPHASLRPQCSVDLRALDAAGAFLGPSQRVWAEQAGLFGTRGWSCSDSQSRTPAEGAARFEANLADRQPALCAATAPESAALRSLLCPPGTVSWCKVAGTTNCLPTDPPPGVSCSAPASVLPDCPSMTAPGSPRLCMAPMGGVVDFGEVPRGGLSDVRLRALNCGGGRLIAPAPSAVEADMTVVDNFPTPRFDCALSDAEVAAQGAFLGPSDRTDCGIVVSFRAVGGDGPKRARFTYRAATGDPVVFDLLARVVAPPGT